MQPILYAARNFHLISDFLIQAGAAAVFQEVVRHLFLRESGVHCIKSLVSGYFLKCPDKPNRMSRLQGMCAFSITKFFGPVPVDRPK